ncbi:MAG: Gfo/Idh/MocA family oxidoreductase [Lentisphaeria bacterium]|nr:Gfo/Idh/MocA family oxidoreductase [Lentisphaeria bacterium]
MVMKKYVVVGTGSRSSMYIGALCKDFKENGQLLALCDTNQARMDYYNDLIQREYQYAAVPTYLAHDFDRMISEQKPDAVIVTSMDRTHHQYICRAMELGCDAITEKPMTIDAEKCQQIIDTIKKTGRDLKVCFNYRYSPRNTKVKELICSGAIGEVISIHFEWLLDTSHGADYFRRWHRDKRNNGGLLVHKSTHHFDLVNWWINSAPETVYAMGDLRFYGKANAEKRGVTEFYTRARGSEIAAKDPFALKMDPENKALMGLYFNAENLDGYYRDQSVFGDGISIEDTMSVIVKYRNKAVMTYSLNAFCPWEGYRVVFNGSKGRLEFNVVETPFLDKDQPDDLIIPGMHEMEGDKKTMVPQIILQQLWGKPKVIEYDQSNKGGHGGGDILLLNDVFVGGREDTLGHAAGYIDGAHSCLTGIAANESIKTGMPVKVKDLVSL